MLKKKLKIGLLLVASTFTLLYLNHNSRAGVFGRQGHWVQRGDTTLEECMKHWWWNDCRVGDERERKNAPIIQVERD